MQTTMTKESIMLKNKIYLSDNRLKKKMKTIFLKLIAFNDRRITNCDQTVEQI